MVSCPLGYANQFEIITSYMTYIVHVNSISSRSNSAATMPQDRRRPRLQAAALLIAVALVPSAPPLPPLAAASSASSSPGKGKRKEKSLAGVLFPGASPESYPLGEPLPVWVEPVQSDRTRVPFGYYDLPGIGNCAAAKSTEGGDSPPPARAWGAASLEATARSRPRTASSRGGTCPAPPCARPSSGGRTSSGCAAWWGGSTASTCCSISFPSS